MSRVDATETQQLRAVVANSREQQNAAQSQHKLITTTAKAVESAKVTASVAATSINATAERQNRQRMAHTVQQQQVPSQKQQQQLKEQMHRPLQQFDTIRQPLATITTTTTLAATQVRAHLSTEMKKLQKFANEMSQQQLPKQQQRPKSANKENKTKSPLQKHANPKIRKQKPLEVVLGQQLRQQQHAAQQQLFTSKPLPTRNRQPRQQNATVWRLGMQTS